ncbi:MAG TPA: response regulator [Terriglobales bacterium]|nr:response regulator [Terriglobales bacterium]
MARRPTLLIVDDEENVARTLQLIFEREGYRVSTANSSAQAIQTLSNGHSFDIVITDLNMEREDIGLEVARFAKRLKPAPIVVICTGFANLNNTRQALTMHVDYLATKPVDLDDLRGALSRLLTRRRDLKEGKR